MLYSLFASVNLNFSVLIIDTVTTCMYIRCINYVNDTQISNMVATLVI
jgi:hypothetical protein